MNYHEDRFSDQSYLVLDESKVIGVIPGEIQGETWTSHSGLTFGGILLKSKSYKKLQEVILKLVLELEKINISKIIFTLPPIKYISGNEESVIYALIKNNFYINRVDLYQGLSTTSLSQKKISASRNAENKGLIIREVDDCTSIMEIFKDTLEYKYGRSPTHSSDELNSLKKSFPEEMRFNQVELDGTVIAGDVIFEYGNVSHIQYLASSDQGKKLRAQDFLIVNHLISERSQNKFLSFGKSTSGEEGVLNDSLQSFKIGYGGNNFTQFTLTANIGISA